MLQNELKHSIEKIVSEHKLQLSVILL